MSSFEVDDYMVAKTYKILNYKLSLVHMGWISGAAQLETFIAQWIQNEQLT